MSDQGKCKSTCSLNLFKNGSTISMFPNNHLSLINKLKPEWEARRKCKMSNLSVLLKKHLARIVYSLMAGTCFITFLFFILFIIVPPPTRPTPQDSTLCSTQQALNTCVNLTAFFYTDLKWVKLSISLFHEFSSGSGSLGTTDNTRAISQE